MPRNLKLLQPIYSLVIADYHMSGRTSYVILECAKTAITVLHYMFGSVYEPPMGKPTICIGENKGADQLRGNHEADQRLCFRYSDSIIPLLLRNFKLLAIFCACTGRFLSDLFGNHIVGFPTRWLIFYYHYNTDWIANTETVLDPNNSVLKRLRCNCRGEFDSPSCSKETYRKFEIVPIWTSALSL